MKATQIPFNKTGFFSKIMMDYLEQREEVKSFYNNFPNDKGFQNQIIEKEQSFTPKIRKLLVEALQNQYSEFSISDATQENLILLKDQNTFTITTGHQLNLFTGPLYFLYKIISTINLCEELKTKFPNKNFVPVYWMATEDHDFEEINYFNFNGKKVNWNSEQNGAVGRFSNKGLQNVLEVFSDEIGNSKNAIYLKELFTKGYLEHENLAQATRYIANELFATYGLIIVDGDDVILKEQFIPFVKDELVNKTSYAEVSKTIKNLEKNYKIQVNPREINLFYLGENFRERITFKDGLFKVNNTTISWTKDEILQKVEENPTDFSPNVIMRPLYQEVILPNLCYIGGGGELAYWMQLKNYFKKVSIPFPILLLRNSVQIISKKQANKLERLNISLEELFLNQHELLAKKVQENTAISFQFNNKIKFLKNHFLDLKEVAKQTDVTFLNAVNAQETKQIKGVEVLKKRLLKAEKKRQNDLVIRITIIQNELLPNQSLEERQRNFSEFYLAYGDNFIKALKITLHALDLRFTILEL